MRRTEATDGIADAAQIAAPLGLHPYHTAFSLVPTFHQYLQVVYDSLHALDGGGTMRHLLFLGNWLYKTGGRRASRACQQAPGGHAPARRLYSLQSGAMGTRLERRQHENREICGKLAVHRIRAAGVPNDVRVMFANMVIDVGQRDNRPLTAAGGCSQSTRE